MVGETLAHYEILDKLGAGGMGEVYRARDKTLGREVAIKVLPEAVSHNPEKLARFEREAHLLASLNHPNVATLYGFEEANGEKFLVMELVEGETLAERLVRGPMPVEEALPLFQHIAEGLEAAHEKGIIHRDLKPANIKIAPNGKPKILDFGLAKAFGPQFSGQAQSESPTVTREGTEIGVILGTAAYMSPEQARGQSLDKRTDIWSFGCVFYEALTGVAPFLGETVSDTIARILEREPEWEPLPQDTPAVVRALLRRCMRKTPERRLHDVSDARIEIEDALTAMGQEAGTKDDVLTHGPKSNVAPWAITVLAVAVAGVAVWAPWHSSAARTPTVRMSLDVPSELRLTVNRDDAITHAMSPDGTRLVYEARPGTGPRRLYMRELARDEAVEIPGTDLGRTPFFSPDGEWLGFSAERKLWKLRLDEPGRAPVALADIVTTRGASWGRDDTIVYSTGKGLMRVDASGGAPEVVTEVDPSRGERFHYWPDVLPNGKGVIYSIVTGADYDDCDIVVQSFDTGERHYLMKATYAKYAPTGHLVYGREDTLYAVPFDLEHMELRGTGAAIQSNVRVNSGGPGAAHFAFSSQGFIAYVPRLNSGRRLFLVDLEGRSEALTAPELPYEAARFSPDGRRLALTVRVSGSRFNIHTYELEHARMSLIASTFEDSSGKTFKVGNRIAWSPDGKRLAVNARGPDENLALFALTADGSRRVERLTEGEVFQFPEVWMSHHKLLITDANLLDRGWGIFELDLGNGSVSTLLDPPRDQVQPALSPDGRWLAYGTFGQVYIAPYPQMEGLRQVSTDGGVAPVWSPDGQRLYYRKGSAVMAVRIRWAPELSIEAPELLFDGPYAVGPTYIPRTYDLAPDGERFVMVEAVDETPTQFEAVLNWFDELEALVPTDN